MGRQKRYEIVKLNEDNSVMGIHPTTFKISRVAKSWAKTNLKEKCYVRKVGSVW